MAQRIIFSWKLMWDKMLTPLKTTTDKTNVLFVLTEGKPYTTIAT